MSQDVTQGPPQPGPAYGLCLHDPVQAEAYINRASLLQNESTNEQLQIHYKVTDELVWN